MTAAERRAAADKAVINTEVPTELKDRLVRYAKDRGIGQAPALRILLDLILTERGYPRADSAEDQP